MNKSILFAVLSFVIAASAFGQEFNPKRNEPQHAILPEQCRADARLWHSLPRAENDKLPFQELQNRSEEMWNCMNTDSGAGESVQDHKRDSEFYFDLWAVYQVLSGHRLFDFVQRKQLGDMFIEEDKAGLR
jgi:hypothetical protein